MKICNSLRYSLFLIVLIAFAVVACEDNSYNYVNPQEYIDAENKLLDDYYNEVMESGRTRLDSMATAAFDTVDNRRESGLMLFHHNVTDLDSVGLFKEVGFRYKRYIISRDSLDNIIEIANDSNYYSSSPVVFMTYILNDAVSAQGSVALGVNEAIQHMREGSTATFILPSSIGGVDGYYSMKYELEVTYLQH